VTVALAAVGGFALVHSVVLLLTTSVPTSRTYIVVMMEMVGAVVGLGGAFLSVRLSKPTNRSSSKQK
jgi:hypothetical protein